MRTWISEAVNKIDRPAEVHPVFEGKRDTTATRLNYGDARERLAVMMRHNAAALLLNRALFEFQADRGK